MKLPPDIPDTYEKTQKLEVELDELLTGWHHLAIAETLKGPSLFDLDVLKDHLMDERLLLLERLYQSRYTIVIFIKNPDIKAEIEFRH